MEGREVFSVLMEVMDNGQLAVAPDFLDRLNLKPGDKLEIFEDKGRFYMENPSMAAYRRVVKSARGIAKKYANPKLIPLEEGAFERAMAEKHDKIS
ncbi:MAG: hypothetical protein IJ631_01810 [Schwartzia sp.]|nr:hypothetical protein [Schwartzia sp. (in: firmicutes)]